MSGDSENVLRAIRRAERNRQRSLPSPGERVPVGFITVGPCGPALRHAVHTAGLTGRVPHLALNVIDPLDPAVVERMLGRCADIIVLEPRPGEVGARILHQAMARRRGGASRPGDVWTTALPGPDDDAAPTPIAPDEMTRPSAVMRRVHHLFARIRTVRDLPVAVAAPNSLTLPRGTAFGAQAMLDSLDRVVDAVGVWLDERGQEVSGDETPPPILSPDGRAVPGAGTRRVVPLERWTADAFRRRGISAIRQTARAKRPWILIVADDAHDDAIDPLRLARAAVPAAGAAAARIEEASAGDHERLIEFIRAGALGEGLFVLIVRDEPPHFMPARLEALQEEIDRLGFTPRQRLISDVERDCAIRPPNPVVAVSTDSDELQTAVRIDRLSRRLARRPIWRVRPMLEQVEIVRTRPPAGRGFRDDRLPLPEVVHGRASAWRVHCAGYRGDGPGVLADVLVRAGRQMGYVVRTIHDATTIGPGRRSWAQILFTQPARGDKPIELSAHAGAGEIDLLLGLDPAESVRALTDDPALRVAEASTTFGVLNSGAFTDQTEDDVAVVLERLERDAHAHLRRDHFVLRDLAGACRAWFHSDRLTDLALLGLAFQEGLIPVTLEAAESAVRASEANGIGRALEAFHFGRRYATEAPRLRPSEDEAADRLCRRLIHRARLRHDRDAEEFATLLTGSVDAMPGLRETDRGRHALHDFVVGLDHCRLWGGIETATALAERVTALYRHDRGSAGRDLTCSAILPLASAMVLRDALGLAAIVTGAEHRRRQRRRLDVKGGREDRIERRFLTRIELIIATWRFRIDLRSSDWAPRAVNRLRPIIRRRVRGSKRERDLRDAVIELVDHATHADGAAYPRLQHALHELHLAAARTQLRAMTADDVRALWRDRDEEPAAPPE